MYERHECFVKAGALAWCLGRGERTLQEMGRNQAMLAPEWVGGQTILEEQQEDTENSMIGVSVHVHGKGGHPCCFIMDDCMRTLERYS